VLHWRKPQSLERSWALIIAAAICLVPANLLPIMRVTSLGQIESDAIVSDVLYLFSHGLRSLAAIAFVASLFVPLKKLILLVFLTASVQRGSTWRPRERTRLYRVTEAVGRWSMVDIYVVAILVAMVQFGKSLPSRRDRGRLSRSRRGADDVGRDGFLSQADLGHLGAIA
jgi:paraquat-inducible protein A